MSVVKFGTSGLRGPVSDLRGWSSYAYTLAFLRHIEHEYTDARDHKVYFGRDLRASSPDILATCLSAARRCGFEAQDCGELPTPALAFVAFEDGCHAIMVTGSHIPDDRNGLKFYRRDGEISKIDEAGINAQLARLSVETSAREHVLETSADSDNAAFRERYRKRYTDFFAEDALEGMRIGVFTHSSVARQILLSVITDLGGHATELGRSRHFVPVDTEAHREEDIANLMLWARSEGYDAIVSTDGDADRPMIADENGQLIRGDLIGLLTARHFGLTTIVTPVTSGSAVDTSGIADVVIRTKVGSPFVIEAMKSASALGKTGIAGFEANGGFILFSDIQRGDRRLRALPTRDALLPILAVLVESRDVGLPLSRVVEDLNPGFCLANRLQDIPSSRSAALVQRLSTDAHFLGEFFAEIGTLEAISMVDGFKAIFDNGRSIHLRPSGNAPELRCYVEAGTAADATRLLLWSLKRAQDAISAMG